MPSVTADTNIYISAYEFGGMPRRFLEQAFAGEFRLDISEAILDETIRVPGSKFAWSAKARRELERDLRTYASFVVRQVSLSVIAADPSDNRILECAAAAGSDFIVSGDARHLLPLGTYESIRIVRVAEFLESLR